MLDRYFHKPVHQYIYWLTSLGIVVGLPLSVVVLSISTMVLSLNFLLEGKFAEKLKKLASNKMAVLIIALFFLHLLGMLWSENHTYGWHDIKIKLPLLSIPVVLLSIPAFPKKVHRFLLFSFVFTTTIISIINWGVFAYQGFPNIDMRELSLFGSHIRFALLVVLSFGICIYHVFKIEKYKWIFILVALWLAYYTLISGVLTGYLCLTVVAATLAFWSIYKLNNKLILISYLVCLLAFACGISYYLFSPLRLPSIPKNLPLKTAQGNLYTHHPEYKISDNGHYLFLYICKKELKTEWNKASAINFDTTDARGQKIYATLLRYMTSKGLHKDAAGFSKLTSQDIHNIEQGISSITIINGGVLKRLKKLKWELQGQLNPNEHSLLQRFEYWETACEIIQDHFIFGVGTGDVNDAFLLQYNKNNSPLTQKNRLRGHQQFLTFWVSFGIFGFILFLLIHFYFTKIQWQSKNILGLLFLIIIFISYLSEDTLETQVGVTFFSFFMALFSQKSD